MIHSRSWGTVGLSKEADERVRTREERRSGVREEPKREVSVAGLRDCGEG